jgi:hypothetical protein
MVAALSLSVPRPRSAAEDPAVWQVAVTGGGPAKLLATDALLAQQSVPVCAVVVEPGLPALHSADDPATRSSAPLTDVMRRLLAEPRVSFADSAADADVVFHIGTPFPGVVSRLGSSSAARRLQSARSVVVADSAGMAAALAKAASGPERKLVAPRLRDIHLTLDEAALAVPSVAVALESLLKLDVNVLVDPAQVHAQHRAGCSARRSAAALNALAERVTPTDSVWVHVTIHAEPVHVLGGSGVEMVILAPGENTVAAHLVVWRGAALPYPGGALLVRAAAARLVRHGTVVPGEYVAVGDPGRAVRAFVRDVQDGRLCRAGHDARAGFGSYTGKVASDTVS